MKPFQIVWFLTLATVLVIGFVVDICVYRGRRP